MGRRTHICTYAELPGLETNTPRNKIPCGRWNTGDATSHESQVGHLKRLAQIVQSIRRGTTWLGVKGQYVCATAMGKVELAASQVKIADHRMTHVVHAFDVTDV